MSRKHDKPKPEAPPVDTAEEAPVAEAPAESEAVAKPDQGEPEAPPVERFKRHAHATLCRVTGGGVVSGGVLYPIGTERHFPDEDVLSLPNTLIPIE